MDGFKSPQTGSMTFSLIGLIGLMLLGLVVSFFLKEPKTVITESDKAGIAA
jgi:LPXTG-motif cell wall-anchored protein